MTPLEPGGQSLNPSHLVVSALKMSLSKRLTVAVSPVSSFAGHLWQPSRRGWIHSVRKNGQDLDPLTRDQMSESEFLDQENLNTHQEQTGRIRMLRRRGKGDLHYR